MNDKVTNTLMQVLKAGVVLLISISIFACESKGSSGKKVTIDLFEAISWLIEDVGQGVEGVRKAGPGPYDFKSKDEIQRYVAVSDTSTIVVNAAGEIVKAIERTLPAYGALYLQHSTAGDYVFVFGPNGKEITPLDGGFSQIDTPGSTNTTDAKYVKNSKGEKKYNQVVRVKAGLLTLISEDGNGFKDEQIFDGTNLPDAEENLFSFDSIAPNKGIGVTSDGYAYFINTDTDEVSRIDNDNVGTGVRDIVCELLSSGDFACVIQSFTEKLLTLCLGKTVSDFSCEATANVGDGVSIAIAETKKGNIGVVSTGYSDSKVYLTEFTPEFGLQMQVEFFASDYVTIFTDSKIELDALGHAEIDAQNGSLLVSDYEAGALLNILFQDVVDKQEELLGTEIFTNWW